MLDIKRSSASVDTKVNVTITTRGRNGGHHAIYMVNSNTVATNVTFRTVGRTNSVHPSVLIILGSGRVSVSRGINTLGGRLTRLLSNGLCSSLHRNKGGIFSNIPPVGRLLGHARRRVGNVMIPNALFRRLNFGCVNPISNRSILKLVAALGGVHSLGNPRFLRVVAGGNHNCRPTRGSPVAFRTIPGFSPSDNYLPGDDNNLPDCSGVFNS